MMFDGLKGFTDKVIMIGHIHHAKNAVVNKSNVYISKDKVGTLLCAHLFLKRDSLNDTCHTKTKQHT